MTCIIDSLKVHSKIKHNVPLDILSEKGSKTGSNISVKLDLLHGKIPSEEAGIISIELDNFLREHGIGSRVIPTENGMELQLISLK